MKKNLKTQTAFLFIAFLCLSSFSIPQQANGQSTRAQRYTSRSPEDAVKWQKNLRTQFFTLLNMEDLATRTKKVPLAPKEISVTNHNGYVLKEIEINSTPTRRMRVVVTLPTTKGKWPAVVSIHGHGGKSHVVYEPSIYNSFATELATRNFVTIAPMVSQHEVYEEGRTLMGERLWDAMRCVDYLESLKAVDKSRIGCAGLSLGGEMAMWLGAMDTRVSAVLSSGFLTKMDQMEQNHCMCWKFDGLRELADFADIYSLIAPRALLCQNGKKEPANDFTLELAGQAMKEIKTIYTDFGRPENAVLMAHPEGHEIDLQSLLDFFDRQFLKKM